MRRVVLTIVAIAVGVVIGFQFATHQAIVEGQGKPGAGFAAVAGRKRRLGSHGSIRCGEGLAEAHVAIARP